MTVSPEPAASADLVAWLSQPATYPDGATRVELRETHISWVFLTDRQAYKLKKPVRFEFLDFSTLELRREACEAEVRLNRRLALDVYLGVLPIVRDTKHSGCAAGAPPLKERFQFGGPGE